VDIVSVFIFDNFGSFELAFQANSGIRS